VISLCLAIETSCDDTSVALVGADGYVHGLVSANQDLAHAPFGGIVPEIACRNHSLNLLPLIEQIFKKSGKTWDEVEGIAVTNRPGLVGSLIVGVVTAKSLAQSRGLKLIGVNHLEGHILAPFLKDAQYQPQFSYDEPFLALAISGGHTSLYQVDELENYKILGATLDDAAGEAFDKFGKMLGFEFPGGVKVDQTAQTGNPKAFDFPRSMIKEDNFRMSFSGLKASGQRMIESMGPENVQAQLADLCASFQEAIVDILIAKLDRAVRETGIQNVIITGGVSANSRLRARGEEWAKKNHLQLQIPPLRYCTDNAAMIGYAGILRMNKQQFSSLSLGPSPNSAPNDFIGEGR
jgi:N6-L-threonylcarbamoyladenine synthase